MDEQIKTIDVEAIMKEIRAEIAERGETEVIPGFDEATIDQVCEGGAIIETSYSESELHDMINRCNQEHNIPYYQMIPAGGLKSFVKRSIRKVISFVIIPLRDAQNRFNSYTVRTFMQLEAYISELETRLAMADERFADQERDIEKLTERLQELEDMCDQLKIAKESGEK